MKLPVPDDQYLPLKVENYVFREPHVLLTSHLTFVLVLCIQVIYACQLEHGRKKNCILGT